MRYPDLERTHLRNAVWDALALIIRTIDRCEPDWEKIPDDSLDIKLLEQVVAACRKRVAPRKRVGRNISRAKAVLDLADLYRGVSRGELTTEDVFRKISETGVKDEDYQEELIRRAKRLAIDQKQIREERGPIEAACNRLGKVWGFSEKQIFNIKKKFSRFAPPHLTDEEYRRREREDDRRYLKAIFRRLFGFGCENSECKTSRTIDTMISEIEAYRELRITRLKERRGDQQAQKPNLLASSVMRGGRTAWELRCACQRAPALAQISSSVPSPNPQAPASTPS